jgi:transcriptional regulator with XRE-family HTH domain
LKLAQTPGERIERAIYAAAALAGVKGSEPELATATGVSRNALRRLFRGGEPRGDILRRIADGLETTTPEALLAAREGRSPDVGLERIANEISELRASLVERASRRGADAERRDWDAERDPDRRAGDEPPDEPGTQ